jgi:nickel-type superoxide dismutase maturation protease
VCVLDRREVVGDSMAPTLVAGERVLVVRLPRRWPVRPGTLVALQHPSPPGATAAGQRFVMVKRVAAAGPEGLDVRGDNPRESTDSRSFGLMPRSSVVGVVLYRYHPEERAGVMLGR